MILMKMIIMIMINLTYYIVRISLKNKKWELRNGKDRWHYWGIKGKGIRRELKKSKVSLLNSRNIDNRIRVKNQNEKKYIIYSLSNQIAI